MRAVYIHYENEGVAVMFVGAAFVKMCVKLLFHVEKQGYADTILEAREVFVNGQRYSDRSCVTFEEMGGNPEFLLELGHIDRHGMGYESLYDIRFNLAILSKSGKMEECIHEVALDVNLEQNIFSNVAVDHIYRDIVPRKGVSFQMETEQKKDIIPDTGRQSEADALFEELHSLPGLEHVKKEIETMRNLIWMRKIRAERGMETVPLSFHMVFSGSPGTGKTTVARLLAKIYKELGVLSKGQLIEADRSDLVSRYIGGTAIKVREIVDRARGGILFIDEAYALTDYKGENDFGAEAVSTLLKQMEDHRDDLIVIVAGYTEKMERFLASNPGLRSRFNRFLKFEDYSPKELEHIFLWLCRENGYDAGKKCRTYVRRYFEKKKREGRTDFANGREVRNLFEKAVANQANRLALCEAVPDLELTRLRRRDVKNAVGR